MNLLAQLHGRERSARNHNRERTAEDRNADAMCRGESPTDVIHKAQQRTGEDPCSLGRPLLSVAVLLG